VSHFRGQGLFPGPDLRRGSKFRFVPPPPISVSIADKGLSLSVVRPVFGSRGCPRAFVSEGLRLAAERRSFRFGGLKTRAGWMDWDRKGGASPSPTKISTNIRAPGTPAIRVAWADLESFAAEVLDGPGELYRTTGFGGRGRPFGREWSRHHDGATS
jgi:hypothetical protein